MARPKRFKRKLKRHLNRNAFLYINILIVCSCLIFLTYLSYKLSVCKTQDCMQTREFILTRYKPSINPCEDFFNYTCGKFTSKWPQPLWTDPTRKKRNIIMDRILFGPERSEYANSTGTARKFYRDCLTSSPKNATAFEGLFLNQQRMYSELFGGLVNWTEITMRARDQGLRYNYFLDVTTQFHASSLRWYLKVQPPPSPEVNIWTLDNFESIKMLLAFWRRSYSMPSDKTIEDLIEFGHTISKNLLLKKSEKGLTTTKLSDMVGISNHIHNWTEFMKRITKLPSITGETEILIDQRFLKFGPYLKKLEQLINRNAYTIWFDYIAILTILDECWFLNIDAVAACATFFNIDKKDFCYRKLMNGFDGIMEAEYIRTVTKNDTRSRILKLAERIRVEMLKEVDKTTFSSPTSQYAIRRNIQSVTVKVGAGDVVFDHVEFEKYYGIDINLLKDDDAAKSYYRVMAAKADKKYQSVIARTRQAIWAYCDDPSQDFYQSGLYNVAFNAIYITPVGMDFPMFAPDRPDYVNCAMIGKVISHEFIHAIFNPGPAYNLKTWNPAADPKHAKRVKCITDQYDAYLRSIRVTMHDPWFHEQENLADVAAANATYRACKKLINKHDGKPLFPESVLSPNQVMWLLHGIDKCAGKSTVLDTIDGAGFSTTVHGIPYYRIVNGPMNSRNFGRDFKCKLGQKMTPFNKCQILGA